MIQCGRGRRGSESYNQVLEIYPLYNHCCMSVFFFLASNSPDEVGKRADDWLAIILFGQIPDKFLSFVRSPWVFATSFFCFCAAVGWRFAKLKILSDKLEWWEILGTDMSYLACKIENTKWYSNHEQLAADINVVAVKAQKNGLLFPSNADGFDTFQSFVPYLTHVSSYLTANKLDHARPTAKQLLRSKA